MNTLPKFVDPTKAVEFLNDSDLVSSVVPYWVWSEELQVAAAAIPSEVQETLKVVSREGLLKEANEVFKDILDAMKEDRPFNDEAMEEFMEKWFDEPGSYV